MGLIEIGHLNRQLGLDWLVAHRKVFSILIFALAIIINLPVIFGSSGVRPLMIDVTAVIGAIVTVFVFFINTLKFVKRQHAEGILPFLIGTILWLCAELTWAYYREGLNVEVPYPSYADMFWLLGYGFFLFYSYKVIAKAKEYVTIERSMIIFVSTAVGLTLGYILNLTFGVADILDSATDPFSMGLSIFYPIIDGIILIPSTIIFWSLRSGDSNSLHWFFISASFIMVTVGDIGFGYSFALSPEVAGEFEWIWSIFFNACYVCMFAGGIWYYLISRRNNVQKNMSDNAMNISS